MAPITSPDIDSLSERSILHLDRSEDSFSTQIDAAGSILGIRLQKQQKEIIESEDDHSESQITRSDPRHGHALRWLLKKFQSAESGPHSPRLHLKAWILLRKLLVRTPPATVARLLKEHKFIKTLKETFHWLHENFDQDQLSSSPRDGAGTASSESGSGSGIESSSSDDQTSARKRKLDGTEVIPHRESEGPAVVLDTLYVAMCGVVEQLRDFIMDPGDVLGYAAEHMRAALKSSPEEAAIILGSSIYLMNHILQTPSRSHRRNRKTRIRVSKENLEEDAFESCISPMIEFWTLRFPGGHGAIDDPQNRAFMRYCMLPSLHLVHTFQEWTNPNTEVDALQRSLTSLLVKHVTLPFRASSGLVNRNKEQRIVSAVVFVDALTLSLRNFRFHEPRTNVGSRGDKKTRVHLTITCLSLLFHIASTCKARDTPASRRAESLWLESLFTQILTCASVVLDPSSSVQAQKDMVRLTTWILRRALNNKISLSTTMLESILERTAGLLDEEYGKGHVKWGLISLCLLHNPNVFLNSSTIVKEGEGYPSRAPNRFLIMLFSHITEDICRRSSLDDNEYSFKLERIVMPLLHAFSDARNLVGFIALWREQLTIVQDRCQPHIRSKNALLYHMAIWENDTLSRSVANLCETNLTVGQVEYLFQQAQQDLDSLGSSGGGLYHSIVILDCAVSGCSRNDTLLKLVEPAQLVFRSLASIIVTKPNLVQGYQWRLWRILTVINGRWGLTTMPQVPRESACSAAFRARDLLCLRDPHGVGEVEPDYSDRLHAFNFLLSFAVSEQLDIPDVSLRDVMVQAIGKVMDLKEVFCRQLRDDHFGVLKPPDADPEWSGQSYEVKSIDTLYIGCIAQLLQSPKALNCLDSEQLERLFEQVYRLATNRRTSSQPLSQQQIDYECLWQTLGRSDTFIENASIANGLRSFQATQFLSLLGSKDPRYWNINSVQYLLAFESIQKASGSALSKKHRIEIANQILRIMLYKDDLKVAKMTEYLGLLTKLIAHPNKEIAILSNASGLSEDNSIEAGIRHEESNFEPALIVLADQINGEQSWSTDVIDCLTALRRLTRTVMKHLILPTNNGTGPQYLKVFYGWLSRALDDQLVCANVTPSRSIVIEEFLTCCSQNRAEVSDSLKREFETLDQMRQRHLETLIENLDVGIQDLSKPANRHYYQVALDSMIPFSDLLSIHPNLRNISASLTDVINETGFIFDMGGVWISYRVGNHLLSKITRLEYSLGTFDHRLHPSLLGTAQIVRKLEPLEKSILLRHFQQTMSKVGWQKKEDLLNTLIHEAENGCLDRASLEVLQRALFSAGGSRDASMFSPMTLTPMVDHHSDELRAILSRGFMVLCDNVIRPDDVHISIISMQCVSILLQRNAWAISQWHVDSLLANITVKASQLKADGNSPRPDLAYLGLCRLFTTVLALHRPKIGGRYHLVLPALQSLLRCLFIPYDHASDNEGNPHEFTPVQASSYARLLSTLADPTVSSVTSAKRRSRLDLNDETKKAKSIAGQHLPYLIMEYCMCQLTGRLTHEMKAALEPGIYAVLNVMTKEGMRTMNAALDESGRAVWKGLYEEWRRFGN